MKTTSIILISVFASFLMFVVMPVGCAACAYVIEPPAEPHKRTTEAPKPQIEAELYAKPECISQTLNYKLDPAFTVGQKQEIRTALQDWTDGTDGMVNWIESDVGVPIRKVADDDIDIMEATAQTMHAQGGMIVYSPTAGYCSNCLEKEGPAVIKLVGSKLRPGLTRLIARHEIGHYLGLHHSAEPGTVMYYTIDKPYLGKGLTEIDKANFKRVWCEK